LIEPSVSGTLRPPPGPIAKVTCAKRNLRQEKPEP
jgi:hypothetical protein